MSPLNKAESLRAKDFSNRERIIMYDTDVDTFHEVVISVACYVLHRHQRYYLHVTDVTCLNAAQAGWDKAGLCVC